MNGFMATGGAVPPAESLIPNSGFWPDISTNAARDTLRLDSTVTDTRLKHALVEAMVSTNDELKAYRNGKEAVGLMTLADVPAEQVNGESILLHHYRRAVYCAAKASLLERYRDYDSTASGLKKADALDEQPDQFRRDARWAIRDVLGRSHSTIELI
ncbi:head completion/stabilization protein [Silvimonas sp.]|uniref:head completion/stabilization protein n=1 Tax=Silvimonas sp. TaxID=2650811 RepID=UPI00283E8716|nr:head completion/stabilization protein [Silvimonas sp.]MDR3429675.1 head completion/stabilization protein [Silvimonas sp.]